MTVLRREMLEILLPRLQAFAATPGKAAFVREPGAQHFALGAYRPLDEYKLASCKPLQPAHLAGDYNFQAALAMRAAVTRLPSPRRVGVLPFFNASARRFDLHLGSCVSRRHSGYSAAGASPLSRPLPLSRFVESHVRCLLRWADGPATIPCILFWSD